MNIAKQIIYAVDGSISVNIDTRVFADCVAWQLNAAKQRASEIILEIAPAHKQSNAALGLLSASEILDIRNHIQSTRDHCNMLEARIMAITWDGTETNRADACDRVMLCHWDEGE